MEEEEVEEPVDESAVNEILTDVPDTAFNGGTEKNNAAIIVPIVVGLILIALVLGLVIMARKGKCCNCFM